MHIGAGIVLIGVNLIRWEWCGVPVMSYSVDANPDQTKNVQ